jgi:hypothetical protein
MVSDWVIGVLVIGLIWNTVELHLLKRRLTKDEDVYDESTTEDY